MTAAPSPPNDADHAAGWRSMLTGMTVFGAAQAVQAAVQIARAKCVAVLLGTSGMGVSSLLASSAAVLQQTAAMGLPASTAREAALAHPSPTREAHIAAVARRAALCLAAVAALACCALAMPLSAFSLGSAAYAWQYPLVGVAVAAGIMADTERALLQGRRRIAAVARASCLSAAIALALSVPMFWLWGVGGISPSMLAGALCAWALCRWGNRDLPASPSMTWACFRAAAWPMLAFGITVMGAQALGAVASYAQNVFVRALGGPSAVGLWQAAATICTRAAAMVFTAMAMDYYPRLTRAMAHGSEATLVMRRQTRLVALATAPVAMLVIVCAPLLIRLLLSSDFIAAAPLLRLIAASAFLQAISYPGGYVAMAAGNKRLYFCMEGIAFNLLQVAAVCIGYAACGLTGIGIAYILLHAISMIVYAAVNARIYGLCYTARDAAQLAALTLAVASTTLLAGAGSYATTAAAILATLATAYCTRRLVAHWRAR